MFKNLVSNLPFSPALIGQVGFYARRLRQEEMTRRAGLVFTALAIIVQSLSVFSPPEAQAQANYNNIIYEGVTSKEQMVDALRRGKDGAGRTDIRQIYEYFGVTIRDIENAEEGSFHSRDFNLGIWDIGRLEWDAGSRDEQAHKIPGTDSTVYARKLHRYDRNDRGTHYRAIIGKRAVDGKWFAITIDCGNLNFVEFPTAPEPEPTPPAPTPAAVCTALQITPVQGSRDKFVLKASAKTEGGATVSRYDFVIKNYDGETVVERNVPSTDATASTELTVPDDGDFLAKVTVQTSAGAKTSDDCAKPLKVTPEPRCEYNVNFPESSPECKPCPDSNGLWYKDEDCKAELVPSKSVINLSAGGGNADNTTVKPGDKLQYTLTVENQGKTTGTMTLRENLADVLEYATIVDKNDGVLDDDATQASLRYITWPEAKIQPGQKLVRTVTVQVKSEIPASPLNVGNPESYNCVMTNSFGTTTNTKVECPAPKVVEAVVRTLPSTGAGPNMLFAGILLMTTVYFYARSRQLGKEIRLVRKEFAAGTL
ncbi:hypothetical protein JNJ66_05795 [Candidatus Saccharibacteria bacterium]|nr:hypothetical protein [Candidatus Saccharibacteria bacterium]